MACGRKSAAVAVAITLALLMAGCAGSGYSYVSSTSTRTFFKVPGAWRVYSRDQVASSQSASAPAIRSVPFLVLFDGDPRPSLAHDLATARYPFGIARVRHLSDSERDTYSLATLRNEVVHIDDLLQSDPNSVDVISPPTLIVHSGLRGTRLAFTVHPQTGPSFSAQQIGLVDAPTHTVWFLLVGCQADCYARAHGTITRVVDSWTVKAK